MDPGLLDVLPSTVGGVEIAFSAEASAEVAADPSLPGSVERLAYAVAADPAGGDLLVAAIAGLREGAFDDPFFRAWRESYDAEVCAQAGGVRGSAETEIDGRNVFIGSCVNGGNTYHVWLAGRRTIVSAFSVGAARFGERLMGELRE